MKSNIRVRLFGSRSQLELLFELHSDGARHSAQLVLSVSRRYSLFAVIAQCSRRLVPDVVLQTPLLLSAATELTLQALHMTFVGDSFWHSRTRAQHWRWQLIQHNSCC